MAARKKKTTRRRKKAHKKTDGSVKIQIEHVIKSLQAIKKHC